MRLLPMGRGVVSRLANVMWIGMFVHNGQMSVCAAAHTMRGPLTRFAFAVVDAVLTLPDDARSGRAASPLITVGVPGARIAIAHDIL